MLIYKDIIVNEIKSSMYVLWMFQREIFENGKRYAKSETTIQKVLVERIPNHLNIKQALANQICCTQYMEYMHIIT